MDLMASSKGEKDSDCGKYYILSRMLHFRSLHNFQARGSPIFQKDRRATSTGPEGSRESGGQCSHVHLSRYPHSKSPGAISFVFSGFFNGYLPWLIIQTSLKFYHS